MDEIDHSCGAPLDEIDYFPSRMCAKRAHFTASVGQRPHAQNAAMPALARGGVVHARKNACMAGCLVCALLYCLLVHGHNDLGTNFFRPAHNVSRKTCNAVKREITMSKWNDVYFRAFEGDDGSYPIKGRALSQCFDIITKNVPVGNPLDLIGDSQWKTNNSDNLVARINNHIYVRGTNLAGKDQAGELYLYYSKASLLLYPSLWKKNAIKLGNNTEAFHYSVPRDRRMVSWDAQQGSFVWNPEMITNDHYCLIARSVTKDNPAPIPAVSDVPNFAEFISKNRSYGWRNVTVTDSKSPSFSMPVEYEQGDVAYEMHFILSCTGLPVGSEVAFECPMTGPSPAIRMNKTKITMPNQDLGVVCHVPAHFKGTITYSYWANGLAPAGEFEISLHPVIFVPKGDSLYQYSKPLEDMGFQGSLKKMLGIGPEQAIVLGEYTTHGRKKE